MSSRLRTPFDTLEVVRLGRTEWRVADAATPENLLGFIERQRADRFEVVWMSDPMRWGYAPSFESALVAFGDSVRFAGEVTAKRASARAAAPERRSQLTRQVLHTHRATWINPDAPAGFV
jgi:hypothetical protein